MGWGRWFGWDVRCLLAAVALGVASWTAPASAALPSPERLVPNTVASVSEVPHRVGTVTRAEFRHALVLVAAAADLQAVPGPTQRGYERLARTAVDTLLEIAWLKGRRGKWASA